MPAFKLTAISHRSRLDAQVDEISCPRCQQPIKQAEEETFYRDSNRMRVVRGVYKCDCDYQVTIVERFPAINLSSKG